MCVDRIFTLRQRDEKAHEIKQRVYTGIVDLEKVYDRVNIEALYQLLRMYNVDGKLLNIVRFMHVNGLTCVRAKGVTSSGMELILV